jgi:hypothetical protein
MYSAKHLAPTWLFILLAAACSAGKSQGDRDAAEAANEVGRGADSRETATVDTQVDQVRGVDAVDATTGLHDAPADVRDGAEDRSVQDAAVSHDTTSGEDSAEVGLSDSGKQDGAKEAGPVNDAGGDAKKLDGAADAPLAHGCDNPIRISLDTLHVDLAATTTGAAHQFDLSCATGGPDVVFVFTLEDAAVVSADTFGATWNTILAFSDTCPVTPRTDKPGSGFVSCNDDACNTTQSQVVAELSSNDHYLILSGANGESGDVTLHFDYAPVGTGPISVLPAGTSSVSGTTGGFGPSTDVCAASGPDSTYWWVTCPDYLGGPFAASTCNGATFNTVLFLQVPRTAVIACNDDDPACGMQSSISATVPPGAGVNVLTVGGPTMAAQGAYSLTYTRP